MSDARQVPWMKWYPADWRADPRLRMCSLAARGLWIELIGYMHQSPRYGFLLVGDTIPTTKQIAMLVGDEPAVVQRCLNELEAAGVFSREDGIPYSRRMERDNQKALAERQNGKSGGNPDLLKGSVPKAERSRPYKRTDNPQKTLRIFESCDGRCHWCGCALQWDVPGCDFFHVDHLVPIRDGGANEESNLVASCATCNHQRARQELPTVRLCSCRKRMSVSVG